MATSYRTISGTRQVSKDLEPLPRPIIATPLEQWLCSIWPNQNRSRTCRGGSSSWISMLIAWHRSCWLGTNQIWWNWGKSSLTLSNSSLIKIRFAICRHPLWMEITLMNRFKDSSAVSHQLHRYPLEAEEQTKEAKINNPWKKKVEKCQSQR